MVNDWNDVHQVDIQVLVRLGLDEGEGGDGQIAQNDARKATDEEQLWRRPLHNEARTYRRNDLFSSNKI